MKKEDFLKTMADRAVLDDLFYQMIEDDISEGLLINCFKTRARCLDIIKYCEQNGLKVNIEKIR